jgi:D-alanyl-lipoteichoic acid acyltransferase DltB (MBOAT superfamily)
MCWKVEYIVLILASTAADYFAGLKMGEMKTKAKRKPYLIFSLIVNLGLLFSFKYFNFFNDSVRVVFDQFNIFYSIPHFNVLLPVGISFYTFQTLSYSIDVYRGKKKPERHLGIFALYVAFFPQLVAGPIERSTRLLPQLVKKYNLDYNRIIDGLQLMMWGFFKKLVIADRVAHLVNKVYNDPTSFTGAAFILATYFFAFQIYCDFSGYSDIAIGAARVFGIDLMKNFKRPYFADSIRDFWKRWHISLSTWFRDYFYKTLGGNKVTKWRWYYNILIVFVISGLWHGANWTFLIWGGLHGSYYLISYWTASLRSSVNTWMRLDRLPVLQKIIRVFITFNLVSFAWIFFRANTVTDAFYIISNIYTNVGYVLANITAIGTGQGIISASLGMGKYDIYISILAIFLLLLVEIFQRTHSFRDWVNSKPIVLRWSFYYLVMFSILLFGVFQQKQFIYFQF